ncbi:hypothetical protein [Candidatus Hamiltonella defensa]|uniref:hypothetical protein n=1 Tax=Candidatus Williamhamiltonella defendens TaxID=138072 RepID=UPI001583F693|nr:hypothetical protein [Candidatus Hamiltonella defensa]
MQSMTLEQLDATARAGGVAGITLKGQEGSFLVEITTLSGQNSLLVKARSTCARRFGNPTSALMVLRKLGIFVAKIDATDWDPNQKDMSKSRKSRSKALIGAHKAAAYNQWISNEIEESVVDPNLNIAHNLVMSEIGKYMATMTEAKRKSS